VVVTTPTTPLAIDVSQNAEGQETTMDALADGAAEQADGATEVTAELGGPLPPATDVDSESATTEPAASTNGYANRRTSSTTHRSTRRIFGRRWIFRRR
jgi:hypothetical protein